MSVYLSHSMAEELLSQVVEEYGASHVDDTSHYMNDGKPGCLIGALFNKMEQIGLLKSGWNVLVDNPNGKSLGVTSAIPVLGIQMPYATEFLLRQVQRYQDMRIPWGGAVRLAKQSFNDAFPSGIQETKPSKMAEVIFPTSEAVTYEPTQEQITALQDAVEQYVKVHAEQVTSSYLSSIFAGSAA